MARDKLKAELAPPRRLTVEEARRGLHGFVREFRAVDQPGGSLLDRAVEVGPHRQGGLLMVPEVDARAAVERIDELEDELEQIGMARLIEERRENASPEDYRPIEELVRRFGLDELLGETDAEQGAVPE